MVACRVHSVEEEWTQTAVLPAYLSEGSTTRVGWISMSGSDR